MLTGLDHIGIAVTDLEQAVPLWLKITGGKLVHREIVGQQKVEVAVIEIGSLYVELLRGTAEDSPITRFVASRGAGIHHIALRSAAAQEELDRLNNAGIRLIDETVRVGAEDSRVGFIHPKSAEGVLLEIVEPRHA